MKKSAVKAKKGVRPANEHLVMVGDVLVDVGPSKPDYSRKVILSPKGLNRREVSLSEVRIADLWHAAKRLNELEDADEHRKIDPDDLELVEEFVERRRQGKTRGSALRDLILEVWHLAHDLKSNLANDVAEK